MEIENEKDVKWPKLLRMEGERKNQHMYTRFHKDNDHNIDDCRQLKDEKRRGKPTEDLIPIHLDPEDPTKVTYIDASLQGPWKEKLTKFLHKNSDVFAWTAADMPCIDPQLITHKLNMDLLRKLIKQKKRSFAPGRQKAIKQEVEKLLKAGFIEEIQFLEWLANQVLVKKENENGGCVWTSRILMMHVPRIVIPYRELTL